jgi:hypothetical protein
VIVGGLALGTLFTLYVIPTAYLLITGRGSAPLIETPAEPAAAE